MYSYDWRSYFLWKYLKMKNCKVSRQLCIFSYGSIILSSSISTLLSQIFKVLSTRGWRKVDLWLGKVNEISSNNVPILECKINYKMPWMLSGVAFHSTVTFCTRAPLYLTSSNTDRAAKELQISAHEVFSLFSVCEEFHPLLSLGELVSTMPPDPWTAALTACSSALQNSLGFSLASSGTPFQEQSTPNYRWRSITSYCTLSTVNWTSLLQRSVVCVGLCVDQSDLTSHPTLSWLTNAKHRGAFLEEITSQHYVP